VNSIQPPRGPSDRIELEWVSIADLGPAEEPDWLWPGFLARGAVTLFTGLWKGGKTTLLAYLLRDLHRGGGLVETLIEVPVRIVSEEPKGLWPERRDALGLPPSIMFLKRDSFNRPDLAAWRRLIDAIAGEVAERDVGLVVFDPLPHLWPVVDENDAGQTLAAVTPLRAITEAGAALLLCHHPRKGDGGQGTATRGSGALPGFVDVLVELRRFDPSDARDTRRVLTAMGRYAGIQPETVIELGPGGYTILGERADVRSADTDATILELLPDGGRGVTLEDVLDGWPEGHARPGKTRLRSILNHGANVEKWGSSGTGVKGSPYRYHRLPAGSDSIQPLGALGGRIESDGGPGVPDGGGGDLAAGAGDGTLDSEGS
jgi:hypothetical protein